MMDAQEVQLGLESSWGAAKRVEGADDAAVLNAASMAGLYLELVSGRANIAIRLLPEDAAGDFWGRVRALLTEAQERDGRLPIAVGG